MQLRVGQKLTIIELGFIAQTSKSEVQVTSLLPDPQRCRESIRYGGMKLRGKRKQFYLDIPHECLVFEGWDIPVKTDGEMKCLDGGSGFVGNACYNLGGPAEMLKDWIENKALNRPVPDEVKGRILVIPVDANGMRQGDLHADGEPLYPEIRTGHSGLEDRKAKARLAA
jgi:hypothetical protein